MKATVVKVAGDVRIRSRGSLVWHDAKANEILSAGDQIETKENGIIELRIENDNVINLKPKSKLVLKTLTRNLKTGDYENLLEVDRGKLRAKVDKIKGKSRFEVKSPTAVACVRGTIIYLLVYPDSTMAFFEEGVGFVTNPFSGQSFDVQPGNAYQIDENGNVTGPIIPDPEQLREIVEGWETLGGEGYSDPGGGEGDENFGYGNDFNNDGLEGTDFTQGGSDEEDGDGGEGITDPDTDGDGIVNSLDEDDDNDKYTDIDETDNSTDTLSALSVPPDNDTDYTSDMNDPDDDNDGFADIFEGEGSAAGTDPLNPDTDGDGLTEAIEGNIYTDPGNSDTDGDGRNDGDEFSMLLDPRGGRDTDSDGVNDAVEERKGTDPHLASSFPEGYKHDMDLDGISNRDDRDIDGDGVSNRLEKLYGLDPRDADSNGEGSSDMRYLLSLYDPDGDNDEDGLSNQEEIRWGSNPDDPDTDNDGVKDKKERQLHSDPFDKDSDGDGARDKEERNAGTNPDHPLSYPDSVTRHPDGEEVTIYLDQDGDGIPMGYDWDDDGDGLADDVEIKYTGTDPRLADSDGDGQADGLEIAEGTDPNDPLDFNVERPAGSTTEYLADTDHDGINDKIEEYLGLNPLLDDSDGDGLKDGMEVIGGLNPFLADTDGDGLSDGFETANPLEHSGLDPFTPDSDHDGINDYDELYTYNTDPDEFDTDRDNAKDGTETAEWWVSSDPNMTDTDGDWINDYNDAFPRLARETIKRGASRQWLKDKLEADEFLEIDNLRDEIDDMLLDVEARYVDSVLERVSDAQTGKVLTDRFGNRVRVEQYVLRPDSYTVEVLNCTLRGGGGGAPDSLKGLHTLDWTTRFNQSLDTLTSQQLKNLPWGRYLQESIIEGRIGGGPTYNNAPGHWPTGMIVTMTNPANDSVAEKRVFSELLSEGSSYWQNINDQLRVSPDNTWRDFTVQTGVVNQDMPGNPKGFIYKPDGLGRKYWVTGSFYVINDSTGLVSGMTNKRFDTIWDALGVNLNGHPDIGDNNLEIHLSSKFGGCASRDIDVIYIPWKSQHWKDGHNWSGSQESGSSDVGGPH